MNILPRLSVAAATVLFLSCIAALQDFSSYQSDGMLLEAGFISIFFAPRGLRPGHRRGDPPSRISLFMLQWEWFRIYFESGVAKLASGDIHWRNLTAMDEYYQNGPLPAWPGWYVEHLPHGFHAATAALTLIIELAIVWALFLPRRFRIACFAIVTALQIGIIATANYAFLNYLVLVLGVLLLDDEVLAAGRISDRRGARANAIGHVGARRRWMEAVVLGWVFYATLAVFLTPQSSSPLLAPGAVARAVPHRESLRPVCHDDRRPVRDRVSGQRGWREDVDRLSVPVQASGCDGTPRHLRAVSAALRVEPVVRVAGAVAGVVLGGAGAGAADRRKSERAEAVSQRSVPWHAAESGAHGALAVLVH